MESNNMSKKVLISGCTGQDGSYMADYLLANTDHEIYGMVRRTAKPDWSNMEKALKNPRFHTIVGDLSDSQSVDNVVKAVMPDYFINLAAQSFVGSSWTIPEQTFDIGALGVIRCLEAIRKHVPSCRFYNAGSSEEFGDVQYIPQDEKHPLRPRSPYGAAKAAARHAVKVWRESYNLYAVQGALFNHESERRGEEFVTRKITLGIARIAHALKNGKYNFEPIVLGNVDAKRDWSHAEDFVEGIWLMLNQDKPKEYVLSSNETHSIREFIEIAFKEAGILGIWNHPIYSDKPEDETYSLSHDGFLATKAHHPLVAISSEFYRPAEVSLLHGDSTLARVELGWKPKNTFNDLVRRMVQHDIKNFKP